MDQLIYKNYVNILRNELVPALGCTEPIAIAYATAKAVSILGYRPEHIIMYCSGNIVKNVQGVTVPNSGGLKGIEAAAILGAIGGDANKELQVLEGISEEAIEETTKLLGTGYCQNFLKEGVANLYIQAIVSAGGHSAEVVIENTHTGIVCIKKDGKELFANFIKEKNNTTDRNKMFLNVSDIIEFANTVRLEDICDVISKQIKMNSSISEEGLKGNYGACVGKTLLDVYGDDIKVRAKARAAAGSDARMSGCSLPVVINSGSGNQGMTASLPVIEYAKEIGASEELLYRALVVSNLIALHQKKYIGNLSAYCGAVSAACGSGAAITYLYGGTYEEISRTRGSYRLSPFG